MSTLELPVVPSTPPVIAKCEACRTDIRADERHYPVGTVTNLCTGTSRKAYIHADGKCPERWFR